MIEGISQKMLTQTLRAMEAQRFVARRVVDPDPPQHVEYRQTPLGESLAEPLVALCHWRYHAGRGRRARRHPHLRVAA